MKQKDNESAVRGMSGSPGLCNRPWTCQWSYVELKGWKEWSQVYRGTCASLSSKRAGESGLFAPYVERSCMNGELLIAAPFAHISSITLTTAAGWDVNGERKEKTLLTRQTIAITNDRSVGTSPIRLCQTAHLNSLSEVVKPSSVAPHIHSSGRGRCLG